MMRKLLSGVRAVQERVGGYSHPRCYAGGLGDCTRKVSQEHVISKSVLRQMVSRDEETGQTGFEIECQVRYGDREVRKVGVNSLQKKVLCAKHNSQLSDFDGQAKLFFKFVREACTQLDEVVPVVKQFNGSHLEKWMLKTVSGLIASGHTTLGKEAIEQEWLEFIFENRPLPEGAGMYFAVSEKPVQSFNSLCITPITKQNGQLHCVQFEIGGPFKFLFLFKSPKSFTGFSELIYRPSGFLFNNRASSQEGKIDWGDQVAGRRIECDLQGASNRKPEGY